MRRVVRRAAEPDEEEEEAEERPVRRRATAKPARRRAVEEEPDEDYDDEPDDDDEAVSAGWAGYREKKAKSGSFGEYFRLEDGDQFLIKFLESAPFASYRQHWIEGLQSTKRKSFVCVETDCALCDAGDDPGFRIAFNVLVLADVKGPLQKPLVKAWEVGPALAEQIEGKAKDKRYGPIDRPDVYFCVGRTGKKSKTRYSLDPVKARDLEEDWEMTPLSEDELGKYEGKMYDRKVIRVPKRQLLKQIAAELQDEGYEDDEVD